jgi:hypothetical protein
MENLKIFGNIICLITFGKKLKPNHSSYKCERDGDSEFNLKKKLENFYKKFGDQPKSVDRGCEDGRRNYCPECWRKEIRDVQVHSPSI